MGRLTDDLGREVDLPAAPRRVVSLVPSLTESVAFSAPELLVGATDWCTHPAGLDVRRVRGTKNPDLAAIRELRPDVVLANKEENRRLDVERLEAAGIPVWVTDIRTVAEALDSLRRLLCDLLDLDAPNWLRQAEQVWRAATPPAGPRVAVPIWRDPWMVVGLDTFTSDLLTQLGCTNVFSSSGERYPHVDLGQIHDSGADVILLPDEPYPFSVDDGPECFTETSTRLVEGRLLTWYGPSLAIARATLSTTLSIEGGPSP